MDIIGWHCRGAIHTVHQRSGHVFFAELSPQLRRCQGKLGVSGDTMLRVGLVGWRGMVGSVLMQRMQEESDFAGLEPVFFSTSNIGGVAPEPSNGGQLEDAKELRKLAPCDVLISCHGGDYTTEIYKPLRNTGWKGYWIDAASTLRMSDDTVIVLDPVNGQVIREGLARGVRTFAGGNCTASLMLMA